MSAVVEDLVERLGGPGPRPGAAAPFLVVPARAETARVAAYRALRRHAFVEEQRLFAGDDGDGHDGDERTVVLVAITAGGEVVGGVRLHPEGGDPALGWWRGSRLVAAGAGRARGRIGAALVGAACATAVDAGALRFDAHVQRAHVRFFERLGWERVRPLHGMGVPHELMRWPIDRFAALAHRCKAPLGPLLDGLLAGDDAWRGDDGVPVPGAGGLVAATDAILPAMVERDPEWAGWCGMLVAAHDLSAMGAAPVGALDTIGARDTAHAERIVAGLRAGSHAFDLPILGGHTTFGAPGSLSVTGLGRAARPVPSGGGRAGDVLTLTADLEGGWRPGYRGRQWDCTSWRSREELARMLGAVARAQPHAAKDVSMAGAVGTAGMLAEASGCGAVIDVAAVPRPAGVLAADWLTCFPGFAMLTADAPGAPALDAGPAVGAPIGALIGAPGVRLRWPDGEETIALQSAVTGLGPARRIAA